MSISGPYSCTIAKHYEGMNITGVTGLTEATIATLKALGAVEHNNCSHLQYLGFALGKTLCLTSACTRRPLVVVVAPMSSTMTTPHKKPRNRELTAQQQAENKVFSSKRIFIEHVIRLIKIFRVASERFCLHSRTYEQVILTVCGLVRLRIGALVLSAVVHS